MLEILYEESMSGKRKNNQDALLTKKFENGDVLLAVADGMGGGILGAELAQEALCILDGLFTVSVEYPRQKLKQSIYEINDALQEVLSVYDITEKEVLYTQKGGTTLSVVYYSKKKYQVSYINIGDSRISLCGKRKLKNLTIDQNKYEENKLKNLPANEEDRRFVHTILGISSSSEIDVVLNDKQWSAFGQKTLYCPEDTIILSTDGFHDYIKQDNFCNDFHTNFWNVLDRVKELSQDNITVIVAKEILC